MLYGLIGLELREESDLDLFWTRVDSCRTRVRLVFIRVDSCRTRVDSC